MSFVSSDPVVTQNILLRPGTIQNKLEQPRTSKSNI